MLEVGEAAIIVTGKSTIEDNKAISSAHVNKSFAMGVGPKTRIHALPGRDRFCCQEDIEVGGDWEVSCVQVLPFSKVRVRHAVVIHTSSGI